MTRSCRAADSGEVIEATPRGWPLSEEATSGQEAIDVVTECAPIVLMDVRMPGVDGFGGDGRNPLPTKAAPTRALMKATTSRDTLRPTSPLT